MYYMTPSRNCIECGEKFEPSYLHHTICSSTCLFTYWAMKKKTAAKNKCVRCSNLIVPQLGKLFCSKMCEYMVMRRKRKDYEQYLNICKRADFENMTEADVLAKFTKWRENSGRWSKRSERDQLEKK